MARTSARGAGGAAAAAAVGATPAMGSEFDFPATSGGEEAPNKQEQKGDDDIFSSPDDMSEIEEEKAPAETKKKRKQAPPPAPKGGAAAGKRHQTAPPAAEDDEEAFLLGSMMANIRKNKKEEHRKKSAAIVSEAREKLKDLGRELEEATAKACASTASDAAQKRLEQWKAELELLEKGVEKTVDDFKQAMRPQTDAINALRDKIAGLAEVGAWSAASGTGGEFDTQLKKIEKQIAAVGSAAQKKIGELKKAKAGMGPEYVQKLMALLTAEMGEDD